LGVNPLKQIVFLLQCLVQLVFKLLFEMMVFPAFLLVFLFLCAKASTGQDLIVHTMHHMLIMSHSCNPPTVNAFAEQEKHRGLFNDTHKKTQCSHVIPS
jgi:hypothetical protein